MGLYEWSLRQQDYWSGANCEEGAGESRKCLMLESSGVAPAI